ncbi:MAG TPA: methyltransferase domain-containing protein [Myxococcales bacterium]|nr:methyltransferase domain-containing protein [Myxococcales bacterium]
MATHAGRSVFVEGTAPGDLVRVRLREDGKVLRGDLVAMVEPSLQRRSTGACPIWDRCGGCDWLHLEEPAQLEAKKEIVLSALEHLAGIPRSSYQTGPVRAAETPMGYRRRAVLHVGEGALGFFGRKSHQLVPVERCPALVGGAQGLPGELSQNLQPILRDVSEVTLLESGGQWSFSVQLRRGLKPKHRGAVERAVANTRARGAVLLAFDGAPELVGDPVLREEAPLAPGVTLRLRPDAFAQAHAGANRALVEAVVALASTRREQRLLELYCGNGNLTFALALGARQVVAVESSSVGLDMARAAAAEAKVMNTWFVLGDARKVAPGLARGGERFDVLVVDPPRTGAPGLGAWAEVLGVRRVVYVACDPASLARDARELKQRGFSPRALVLVELFPQTHHVEAVMAFGR